MNVTTVLTPAIRLLMTSDRLGGAALCRSSTETGCNNSTAIETGQAAHRGWHRARF